MADSVGHCPDRLGDISAWTIPQKEEIPPAILDDAAFINDWKNANLNTGEIVKGHRDGRLTVTAWFDIPEQAYIGVTVIHFIETNGGKLLEIILASARPGSNATKRIMPDLVEVAKRCGCYGVSIIAPRRSDKLFPGFKFDSARYIKEF